MNSYIPSPLEIFSDLEQEAFFYRNIFGVHVHFWENYVDDIFCICNLERHKKQLSTTYIIQLKAILTRDLTTVSSSDQFSTNAQL